MFDNTTFDFKVPQPSEEQVNDFNEDPIYKEVIPYYFFNVDFLIGEDVVNYNLSLFDNFDVIGHTPYTSNRLIEKGSFNGNLLYIDYDFSKAAKLNIGDTVKLRLSSTRDITYVVTRIYENNLAIYGSSVIALFDGEIKDFILESRSR